MGNNNRNDSTVAVSNEHLEKLDDLVAQSRFNTKKAYLEDLIDLEYVNLLRAVAGREETAKEIMQARFGWSDEFAEVVFGDNAGESDV